MPMDFHTAALWLIGHAGAVMTATMFVLAWLRRRGSSHLRGLRVRVRYRGVDCLCWAATPWYCLSRVYWLARYPRDWEIARTLREGLLAAGIAIGDGTFRGNLQQQIRLARQAGLLQAFERMPVTTEVRTPIEDRAVECRLFEEVAAASAARGWHALAAALRATAPSATDSLAFQAVCDIWLRTTQPMLLDVVFRQIDKAVCQLNVLSGTVDEMRAESKHTTAAVEQMRTESKHTNAAVEELRREFGQASKATTSRQPESEPGVTLHQLLRETQRLARQAMVFGLLSFVALVGTLAFLLVWFGFVARP